MIDYKIRVLKRNMLLEDGTSLFPKKLVFYPTLRCNLNCKMCYQRTHDRFGEELSIDDIRKIFSNYTFETVMLVGGEIFVRNDIVDIINFFATISNEVNIQTNASLITAQHIEALKVCNKVKNVWISLDGLKETHDRIRGRGVFEKAIKVIRELDSDTKLHINTVILKENVWELLELYRFLKKENVSSITFQYEMKYNKKEYEEANIQLADAGITGSFFSDCVMDSMEFGTLDNIKDIIDMLKNEERECTKIHFAPCFFAEDPLAYKDLSRMKQHNFICRDLVDGILKVDPAGNVMLCEAMNLAVYNLRESSIEEIWNSKQMKQLRKSMCSNNMFELCYRCCCAERY